MTCRICNAIMGFTIGIFTLPLTAAGRRENETNQTTQTQEQQKQENDR